MGFLDKLVSLVPGHDLTPGFNLPDVNAVQPAGTYNAFGKNAPAAKPAAPKITNTKVVNSAAPQTLSYTVGGGSYDPAAAQAAALQSQYTNDAQNHINNIINAYNALNGTYDQIAHEKLNDLNKSYDQNVHTADQNYAATTGATQAAYGGRGIGDSSFTGNALDSEKGAYQQGLQSLSDQKNSNLAQIGQANVSAKAADNNNIASYQHIMNTLGGMTADQLNELNNTLSGDELTVGNQQAGVGTNSSFINSLNALPGLQDTASPALQQQLQAITNSSAPTAAQGAIAQATIARTDPNNAAYWLDYFQQLQQSSPGS